jgi:hypothetical protein
MSQTKIESGFIGNNSVLTASIADNTVTTAKIVDSNVTSDKIATNAISFSKLDSSVSGAFVPIGGIIMWSGSVATIPPSWRLCNGANGTPNLQDRFVVGAGSGYNPGATGGSANATLVDHNHGLTGRNTGGSTLREIFVSMTANSNFPNGLTSGIEFADGGTSSIGRATLNNAGSSGINANLPPYYALAFIMRVS